MSRRLRIACIDKEPADRIALRELLDDICKQHRDSIGHFSFVQSYPASIQEVLLNAAPQAFAIGPRLELDEAYALCSDLQCAYPEVPIYLFIEERSYKLRTLRHFDKFCRQIFSESEPSLRIMHALLRLFAQRERSVPGNIVNVMGAKGGAGVTSLVIGLAHAAEALGIRALVTDFSYGGVIPFYLACEKWDSTEYTAALSEGFSPNPQLLENSIVRAPNGITVLLPPAGGAAVRELWLRNPDSFEFTLSAFDYFAKRFDLILVDQAGVEGVLPFALNCRARTTLLVSSNEAASVHLLGHVLSDIVEAPGDTRVRVVLNELRSEGLQHRDMVEFLSCYPVFSETMALDEPVPHDTQGKNWIGTGNSFYTESRKSTKKALERLLEDLVKNDASDRLPNSRKVNGKRCGMLHETLQRMLGRRSIRRDDPPKALPAPVLDNSASLQHQAESYYEPPTVCQ